MSIFFSIHLVKHCTLHILNLGLLHVSNGSCLCPVCTQKFWGCCCLTHFEWGSGVGMNYDPGRALLLHMNYFGPVHTRGNPVAYKDPLNTAYESFQVWRAAHRIPSSQRRFNFWMVFREEFGAYLNTKGYNARVISLWLEHEVETASRNPPPNLIPDDRLQLSLAALKFGPSSATVHFVCCMFVLPHEKCRICICFFSAAYRKAVNRYCGLTERACRALPPSSKTIAIHLR